MAVIQSSVVVTGILVEVIAALREGIAAPDGQIEQAAAAHPDFALFQSFPGAGPVLAPRLLAAFGSQRDRYGTAAEVQQFSGIAPVLERSGKSEWFTSAGPVQSFSGKRFMNGQGIPLATATGLRPTMNSSAKPATAIMPRSARLPSSGFVSRSVAGKTVSPTTIRAMSRVFAGADRRWRRPSRGCEPNRQRGERLLGWNYSDDSVRSCDCTSEGV